MHQQLMASVYRYILSKKKKNKVQKINISNLENNDVRQNYDKNTTTIVGFLLPDDAAASKINIRNLSSILQKLTIPGLVNVIIDRSEIIPFSYCILPVDTTNSNTLKIGHD